MQNKMIETLVAEGVAEFGNGIYKMSKCVTLKKSEGVIDSVLSLDGKVWVRRTDGFLHEFGALSFTDRLRIARKVFHHISRITEKK